MPMWFPTGVPSTLMGAIGHLMVHTKETIVVGVTVQLQALVSFEVVANHTTKLTKRGVDDGFYKFIAH